MRASAVQPGTGRSQPSPVVRDVQPLCSGSRIPDMMTAIPQNRGEEVGIIMKKLLGLDLVLSECAPPAESLEFGESPPPSIALAATFVYGGEERLWYSVDKHYLPAQTMELGQARSLLNYLRRMQNNGLRLCSWNGLGGALKYLGQVAERPHLAVEIALRCCDPMFQLFNQTGHVVTLAQVAQAMGVPQAAFLNPEDAPDVWRTGRYGTVMDYLIRRCRNTAEIVWMVEALGEVRWVSAGDTVRQKPIRRLRAVEEVLREPEPDPFRMDTPIPRSRFSGWLDAIRQEQSTRTQKSRTPAVLSA